MVDIIPVVASILILPLSLPQSGCLVVSSSFNTLGTRLLFLKFSLEGGLICITAQGREKRAVCPQDRSPWAVACIPALPWHQWNSHKSVIIYPTPHTLWTRWSHIAHRTTTEHKSREGLQGKKDFSHAAHTKLPLENEQSTSQKLVLLYLIQHFLG